MISETKDINRIGSRDPVRANGQSAPMHWLIDCWRAVLLYGAWPDPGMLLRFAAAALLALFLGGRFFLSPKTRIPDLL